ncbi:MAG: DUF4935 domain-containing protein [Candidatus Thiodiazotropha sp. (ex Monitilora ramsayi)]|nr:DUF4935 domain-containing protein [Candidatus Thiodiazotropha sp. (ex Monitilora ramsayi)]
MPRIKRKRPPKHVLIPDTSILWYQEKDLCVCPEFTAFWDEYGVKYEIDLIIPEVVRGELLYQHTTTALKTLERINKQFDNLSGVANKRYGHRVNPNRVRNDVGVKFDTWISSVSATIFDTPIADIDWRQLIQNAIWRHLPFIEDKDKRNEKGFRDALILETVISIVSSNPHTDIAFISNDTDLLSATKKRLKPENKCSFYETLDEFSSFLRLLDEQLTNEFVQAIQKRAREKFHSEKDSSCIIYRDNIVSKIREQFESEFAPPIPSRSLGLALASSPSPITERWDKYSSEGIWIRAPSFVELHGESEFVWDSRVTFVQLFKYSGPGGGGLILGMTVPGQENLRKLEFRVTWKAHVGKDARFRKMETLDIQLSDRKFEPATDQEKDRYGVQPISE